MGTNGRPSISKRQKEQVRQDRQRDKEVRRQQRKLDRQNRPTPAPGEADVAVESPPDTASEIA